MRPLASFLLSTLFISLSQNVNSQRTATHTHTTCLLCARFISVGTFHRSFEETTPKGIMNQILRLQNPVFPIHSQIQIHFFRLQIADPCLFPDGHAGDYVFSDQNNNLPAMVVGFCGF